MGGMDMGNEFLENMYKQIKKPKSPLPFMDMNTVLQQKEDDNMVSVDKTIALINKNVCRDTAYVVFDRWFDEIFKRYMYSIEIHRANQPSYDVVLRVVGENRYIVLDELVRVLETRDFEKALRFRLEHPRFHCYDADILRVL